MNERARALGLRDTHFANPIGLDDPQNFSTAWDLSKLAQALLEVPFARKTVALGKSKVHAGGRRWYVRNHNELIGRVGYVDGVKTGTSTRAGYNLVATAHRDGVRLMSVVLGTPSEHGRQRDTLRLLNYGFARYRAKVAVGRGVTLTEVPIYGWRSRTVGVAAQRSLRIVDRHGANHLVVYDLPDRVAGPLAPGSRVGTVRVLARGRTVSSAPLVTLAAVPKAGIVRRSAVGVAAVATSWQYWLSFACVMGGFGVLYAQHQRRRKRRRLERRRERTYK
jgi:D-alanyl-D-alanine carboxypeptidase (penicillin-binding protein 5/6)